MSQHVARLFWNFERVAPIKMKRILIVILFCLFFYCNQSSWNTLRQPRFVLFSKKDSNSGWLTYRLWLADVIVFSRHLKQQIWFILPLFYPRAARHIGSCYLRCCSCYNVSRIHSLTTTIKTYTCNKKTKREKNVLKKKKEKWGRRPLCTSFLISFRVGCCSRPNARTDTMAVYAHIPRRKFSSHRANSEHALFISRLSLFSSLSLSFHCWVDSFFS